MIAEGRRRIISGKGWVTFFLGFFIMLGVIDLRLIGEGLPQVLNPKLRVQLLDRQEMPPRSTSLVTRVH